MANSKVARARGEGVDLWPMTKCRPSPQSGAPRTWSGLGLQLEVMARVRAWARARTRDRESVEIEIGIVQAC